VADRPAPGGAADRPAPPGRAPGPYRPGTRVVRAAHGPAAPGAPTVAGPVLSSTFHPGGPDSYGRAGNPSWRAYEAALADLEGGGVVLFASGLAALSAVLLTTLRPGDTLVLPADGYYLARAFVRERLTWVRVREVPAARPVTAADVAGARLVLLESPSNPWLDVVDLPAAVAVAHAAGALVAVDNTTATVLGQQPLALGADFSVCSDTKATTGHGDLVLGHVAAADPDRLADLRSWRTQTGAVAGPWEAWLALRSLGTLELRLTRQSANALALAGLLAGHPAVTEVRYPGPAAGLAHRGGVLTAVFAGAAAAERFVAAADLVADATSFGDLRTSADRRARWGDPVPPGLVRVSAGVEDPADLLADVGAALDAVVDSGA
jgi:cystathionine gamma-lyase